MTTSETSQASTTGRDETIAQTSEYQSVSTFAIVALLVGLASGLAFIHPMLWTIPVLAVALSGVALYRIAHSDGEQVGRKLALAGLVAALVLGSAAASKRFVFQWAVQRDARAFALLWFDLLAEGEPHKAHQLANSPLARQRLDSDLWEHYRNTPEARKSLHDFVEQPLARILLEVGDRSDVRPFNSAAETRKGRTSVRVDYSVSFESADGLQTLFCSLFLDRTRDPDSGNAEWQLKEFKGPMPSPFD